MQERLAHASCGPFLLYADLTRRIRIVLLLVTCAIAADLPNNIVAITEFDVPVVRFALPPFAAIWAPFLLTVVWFNAICDGEGRFALQLDRSIIWLMILLAVMGMAEFGHAVRAGTLPNPELLLRFGWICFVFVTLTTFARMENAVFWQTIGLTIFSGVAAVLMLTVPAESLVQTGAAKFFQQPFRPSNSVVNSGAYLFALTGLLGLGMLLFTRRTFWWAIGWMASFALSTLGVLGTKSRGAWLVLIIGCLMLFAIKALRSRILVPALIVFGIAGLGVLASNWDANRARLEDFLSLGRGLSSASEIQKPGQGSSPAKTSANVRIEMLEKSFSSFLERPLLGKGLAEVLETRTMGHAPHAVPLQLLASYGLVALLPVVGFACSLLARRRSSEDQCAAFIALGVIALSAFALQYPPLWFAGALALAVGPEPEGRFNGP